MHKALISLLCLLFLFSCKNSDRETIEVKKDDGFTERFERSKKNLLKDGLYQKISPEGKVVVEAHYKLDSLDGERKYFYPGGALESVENFVNGQYHGPFKAYFESGKIKVEQTYEHGAMQGLSTVYYENGHVKEKVMMKDNEESGSFAEYWENGNLHYEGNYVPTEDDGAPLEQGELKEYDENGQLIRIAQCEKGVCKTTWKKNE